MLVGGWTNPSEKYARQIGNLPQIGLQIKSVWNHHLEWQFGGFGILGLEVPLRIPIPFENRILGIKKPPTQNWQADLFGVWKKIEHIDIHSLKLTAKAPENGWLEYDCFLLGWPIFRCYVSFREGISPKWCFFMVMNPMGSNPWKITWKTNKRQTSPTKNSPGRRKPTNAGSPAG